MSKSIKDYKDAMDNIKISDSFYKRTEVMLSDLSDMELEKKPAYSGRRITAFVMTAAACLACVIGVKVMVDSRRSDIASDETGITEILTSETSESFVTLPIVDDLDGGGDDSRLVDDEDADALSEIVSDNTELTEKHEKEQSRAESEEQTSAAEHEDSEITENAGDAPAADVPSDDKTGGLEAAPTIMGADSGSGNDGAEPPAGEGIDEDTSGILPEDDTDQDEENAVQTEDGAAVFPELRATAVENITVEVTPYFNMGDVKSGEGAIKLNGAECADIINSIADISENSHEMGSYSFKSVFSLQLYDETYGETYYSIYVTDLNAMIINKHGANGQSRDTYGVQEDAYEELLHKLYLLFGSESDYELFGTLMSGK